MTNELPRPSAKNAKARDLSLWQVITERRQEHVLRRIGSSAYTPPDVAVDVGILRSPLKSAFRTSIKPVPEPDRAFKDVPRIPVAIGQPTGIESAGKRRTHRAGNRNGGGAGCS